MSGERRSNKRDSRSTSEIAIGRTVIGAPSTTIVVSSRAHCVLRMIMHVAVACVENAGVVVDTRAGRCNAPAGVHDSSFGAHATGGCRDRTHVVRTQLERRERGVAGER